MSPVRRVALYAPVAYLWTAICGEGSIEVVRDMGQPLPPLSNLRVRMRTPQTQPAVSAACVCAEIAKMRSQAEKIDRAAPPLSPEPRAWRPVPPCFCVVRTACMRVCKV